MFVPIKSILSKGIAKPKTSKAFEEREIAIIYAGIAEEVLNKKAAQNSRALFLKNRILTVTVPSSVWACQLQFVREDIIKKINNLTGREMVERIIFRIE